ncbi:hypothetical protein RHMOL_Rhmol13G0137100 [Rhododendron molle]|uniref:Uncharacterized protein n=1 Tax=Rhododendron molle TaxID=49168 RepID=A0ACC0L6X1_RHOML|nr:hypothetical protein RHMOL_Rhmol13G0137100 [Rhododendron molle]
MVSVSLQGSSSPFASAQVSVCEGMESMDSHTAEASVPWRRLSCTISFAALCSCYYGFHVLSAPVHQTHRYYWIGVLDNYCKKWNAFFRCLYLVAKLSFQVEARQSHPRRPTLQYMSKSCP